MSAKCEIDGCTNDEKALKAWQSVVCPKHDVKQGTTDCDCEPPFVLLSIPADPSARLEWINKVSELKGDKNWHPSETSHVCSKHFVDGAPTEQNPVPSPSVNLRGSSSPEGGIAESCVGDQDDPVDEGGDAELSVLNADACQKSVAFDAIRDFLRGEKDEPEPLVPETDAKPSVPETEADSVKATSEEPRKPDDKSDTSLRENETLKITAVRSLSKTEDLPSQTTVSNVVPLQPKPAGYKPNLPSAKPPSQPVSQQSVAQGPHITLPSGLMVPVCIAANPTTGVLQIMAAPAPDLPKNAQPRKRRALIPKVIPTVYKKVRCLLCGFEKKPKGTQDVAPIPVKPLTSTNPVPEVHETNAEIMMLLFPGLVKEDEKQNINALGVICDRCSYDLGYLFKNLRSAQTIQTLLVKKMAAAFPDRDNSLFTKQNLMSRAAAQERLLPDPTKHDHLYPGSATQKPPPPIDPRVMRNKAVQTSAVPLGRSTQTKLTMCDVDHDIPEAILMSAMVATDALEKNIKLSAQECRIGRSRECGYSMLALDADSNLLSLQKPSREVVLVQVPRGPVSSVGVQTYQTSDGVQKGNLCAVTVERGTGEGPVEKEVRRLNHGQCAVCGSKPVTGQKFRCVHSQDSEISRFLLKYCGVFHLKEGANCICYGCEARVLTCNTTIRDLNEKCKNNLPLYRETETARKSRKRRNPEYLVTAERATDSAADQPKGSLTEQRAERAVPRIPLRVQDRPLLKHLQQVITDKQRDSVTPSTSGGGATAIALPLKEEVAGDVLGIDELPSLSYVG